MTNRRLTTVLSAFAGAAALVLTGALAAAPATADPGLVPSADGVPEAGSPAAEWYAWAQIQREEARSTDWAAEAASRGCSLVSVTITDTTMPEDAAAVGAPVDLLLPVVDRVENCQPAAPRSVSLRSGATSTTSGAAAAEAFTAMSVAAGSDCNTTSGPGSICISRSGSSIVASFTYYGSNTIKGYIRIYDINAGASGCPSGTTLRTGAESTYTYGTSRSTSLVRLARDAYSTHFWRNVGLGHYTSWGSACGVL